jgi:hypothetical protein
MPFSKCDQQSGRRRQENEGKAHLREPPPPRISIEDEVIVADAPAIQQHRSILEEASE